MDYNLYVIKGKENAGKTSTCWMLLNKLKEQIEFFEYWDLRSSQVHTFDSDRQVYLDKSNKTCDFVVIVTLKITHQRIAIISAGDEEWRLKKDIFYMLYRGVNYIVCCSRTQMRRNSTLRMLNRVFAQHIKCSEELPFSKEVILRQKYEEEVAERIYQQLVK